ncbi:MAG: type II toxin-antitoxin system Phd/YefM family antitoxin [Rhodobacteraceae bacterium]|nr:type II toxin-antitoxin system Phd/YefM family antitoxin [Paracoccaceae bacterium]
MARDILARTTASVSELKRNPMATVACGDGAAIAILNRNVPAFYCVPADEYAAMIERLENAELNVLAESRTDGPFVSVSLDEL